MQARRRFPLVAVPWLLGVCVLLLSACNADQQAPQPVTALPDFTGLVSHVSPAVVNISALPPVNPGAEGDQGNDNNNDRLKDWLRRFFNDEPRGSGPMPNDPGANPHPSLGSGFIISPAGYILTNRHVIAEAGRIVVKLNDRRQLLAKVVGDDDYSDLALLKVDAEDLPTVQIGDPSELPVGSWVVAIGSPFGFETSVTAGIVSAKQRNLASDQYVPFLQTDVAINPGNSGGPLFNLAGEVVGINSQIYSQTGGYQGVSFAIPIDIAMDVAKQLRDKGSVTRGWLGVQIQDVDRELAHSFKLKRPEGALVARVMAESPAAAAGVEPGDVILAFDGHAIDTAAALPPLVSTVPPGETATVTVLRDGARQDIDVTIDTLPKDLAARGETSMQTPDKSKHGRYGLTLEPLSEEERHQRKLNRGGVKVLSVGAGAGAEAGLQTDDVILAVDTEHVESVEALRRMLNQSEGPVALLVLRDGGRLYLAMRPRQG